MSESTDVSAKERLREAFEEWAETEDMDLSIRWTHPRQYTHSITRIAWDAFQAGAAIREAQEDR